MELYIIRHGETDFNLQKIVQGSKVNSSLNGTGKLQARAFYMQYKQVEFDHIYLSKLARTRESVDLFIQDGLPYTSFEGLNEISWGVYEGKPHNEEFEKEYCSRVEDWRAGRIHIPVTGGESPFDMSERQKEVIHAINQSNAQRLLICMHGRAMKSFLCLLTGLPVSDMDRFSHSNTGLYILSRRVLNQPFNIVKENDLSHLTGVTLNSDIT